MTVTLRTLRAQIFDFKDSCRMGPWREEIARGETMLAAELHSLNWERRKRLVQHCAEHVPYYRELFRRIGFSPRDLTHESVYGQLPILEKESIREHNSMFAAENVPNRFRRPLVTGGSTGEPLKVFADSRVPLRRISSRFLRWWGADLSDNSGYLYRAVPRGLRRILIDIALYPTRRAYIHAAEMTRRRMADFHRTLVRIKPAYLVGYVGAVEAFADYVSAIGVTVPGLRAIWTTAAPLPEFKRCALEHVFQCPVYTQYGSVEVAFISAECERQEGMHVFSDIRHVEVVAPDGSAVANHASGDLVVTDLTNYAFPILRYRIGDRGSWMAGECNCGRAFPRLDYVKGRTSDRIRLPDGTSIPGEYWTTIFDDWPGAVKAFQVHQAGDWSVNVRYQPVGPQCDDAIAAVRRMIEPKLRGLVSLDFIKTEVDINDNGKTRYVTSDLIARESEGRP